MASVQKPGMSTGRTAAFDEGTLFSDEVREYLKPLASLKLSVFLFACGIFLVLAGTLAQVEKDIWEVVHGYFRCWIAWIDLQVFFPKTWFPQLQNVPWGFWFPGGWTIGGLMALNLLAAHSLRFRIQAKGQRLAWGLSVTLVGVLLTWAVIEFGTGRNAVYETASLDWSEYWNWLCYGLLIPALGCGVAASKVASDKKKRAEFYTYSVISLLFLGTSVFLIAGGESVRLNNSYMRILWQLIQATFAGAVLLGGCLLLFKKRAGVVLLHAGVLLLMANEIVVHSLHEESKMILLEGETANYTQDTRSSELAIVDRSNPEYNQQTVIPDKLLIRNTAEEQPISDEQLPFDVKVREFFKNSDLRGVRESDDNPATTGIGESLTIVPARPSTGTESEIDYPAAYVDLIDKESGETIHTLAVSAVAANIDQNNKVKIGETTYDINLRFKRIYKPYSIHLIDVRKDDYIGTTTPMNYSSDVRLVDESRNEDRKVKIWMNNPLRYAGDTLYQSGYQQIEQDGEVKEVTTLQVVSNEGWMIPYVACMIVVIGMAYHFVLTLFRFLNRFATGRLENRDATGKDDFDLGRFLTSAVPTIILIGVGAYWLNTLAQVPEAKPGEFDYYSFGKIPVVKDGRVKPIDTMARNSLRILSNRETIRLEPEEEGKEAQTLPATQWLLELAAGLPEAAERPVIRIVSEEVRSTLDLERRKSHRYSISEIQENFQVLLKAADEAHEQKEKDKASLSIYQQKVLELERKIGLIDLLTQSLTPPRMNLSSENMTNEIMMALARVRQLDQRQPPLLIPPVPEAQAPNNDTISREDWETYSKAFLLDIIYPRAFQTEPNPFSGQFSKIVFAYQDQDPEAFNKAVQEYHALIEKSDPKRVNLERLAFEVRFNNFAPFFYPAFLYILVFVIAAFSWLLPRINTPANRAAMGLVLLTFVVHSWAMWARMQISGRPPITNLYSSAVFIGWAGVLAGLIIEAIFKRGIGNAVSAAFGFGTLWIAHGLAGDGDTFTVLQAVLDTQFWLSTHVVMITLGYAATFLAGLLGIFYVCFRNPLTFVAVIGAAAAAVGLKQFDSIPVLFRNVGPFLLAIPVALIPMYLLRGAAQLKLPEVVETHVPRMIYGTLCFALLFSFFGTVLGGLWADDSWGRFWGWDPKENGALIIVLWNALVLHARWDKIIGKRGLALMAIAGNITTAWSWFGVNELGVGLHSYGFTEGVLFNLSLFVLSQLTLITIGVWGSDDSPSKDVTQTSQETT